MFTLKDLENRKLPDKVGYLYFGEKTDRRDIPDSAIVLDVRYERDRLIISCGHRIKRVTS